MSFLLALIAFVFAVSLGQRVRRLEELVEKKMGVLESSTKKDAEPVLEDSSLSQAVSPHIGSEGSFEVVRPSVTTLPTNSADDLREFDAGAWLAKDWPVKLGALLLLLGFGWLVSYAFANNWIGPVGRISLGILAGLAILVIGEWRIRSFGNQGSIFLALGASIVLLTVFAARTLYDFFTPTSALILMFLVVVFVAFSSVIHRNKPLALLGLILGGIIPLLVAGQSDFVGLFAYLFLLSTGTLWVVRLTDWRVLTLAAWIVVLFYSLPFVTGFVALSQTDQPAAVFFAFLFAALFYGVNLVTLVRNRRADFGDLVVAVLSTLLLIFWIDLLIIPEWKSIVLTAVALFSALGSWVVFQATKAVAPLAVYSGKALAVLGIALAYELSGPALMIAYILEASTAVAGACFFSSSASVRRVSAWLMIVPMLMSLESISRYGMSYRVFTGEFFSLVILMVALFALSTVYRWKESKEVTFSSQDGAGISVSSVFLAAGWFYALTLVWQGLHAGIQSEDFATGLALFVYTVMGIFLHIQGKFSDQKYRESLGNILLGLVALRLLLVEVWDMSIGGRIVVFLLIGTLFMSTAFLGNKKKI